MYENRVSLELLAGEKSRALLREAEEARLVSRLVARPPRAGRGFWSQWLASLMHQVRMLI